MRRITHIRRALIRRFEDPEGGAALPFVAVMLVVLMGMAAFAVDLGWLYVNGARVQRAADASALAGVVYLPGFTTEVTNQVVNGANANGWDVGTVDADGTPIAIAGGGSDSAAWRALDDNRLEVTLTVEVPTFFLKALGFNSMDISKRATAEYIKPVPIGSPFANFGDGTAGIWGAISGKWTAAIQGDPFSPRCDWTRRDRATGNWTANNQMADSDCLDSSLANRNTYFSGQSIFPFDIDANPNEFNPTYRSRPPTDDDPTSMADGYYYGIEIRPLRDNLTVQLWDPRHARPSGGCGNATSNPTGDCDRLTFSPLAPNIANNLGPTTRYRLYRPDATPLDPRDGLGNTGRKVCDISFNPTTDLTATGVNKTGNPATSVNWYDFCSVANPDAGIWILRVSTDNGTGSNQYGVRASTTGTGDNTVKVYGINEVSIYANVLAPPTNPALLYLAEVHPAHAGKFLHLRFYDAGEDQQPGATFRILRADGTTAQCVWAAQVESEGDPDDEPETWPDCLIVTSVPNTDTSPTAPPIPPYAGVGRFNSQWLDALVHIPRTYSCDPTDMLDCWWRVAIVNNSPHDRTTWQAQIVGNPVRLVPNP